MRQMLYAAVCQIGSLIDFPSNCCGKLRLQVNLEALQQDIVRHAGRYIATSICSDYGCYAAERYYPSAKQSNLGPLMSQPNKETCAPFVSMICTDRRIQVILTGYYGLGRN